MSLSHKNFLFGKILMTSFHVICDLGLPQSKILGTPINWRSPEKSFLKTLFFWRPLAPVFLVLGLGLEHSCPRPREVLSSKRLSLASDFFVSLASSIVSSTPPLLRSHCLDSCSCSQSCDNPTICKSKRIKIGAKKF